MYSDRESDLFQRFEAGYQRRRHEVFAEIERQVCGCDFGASSWTTKRQADVMIAELGLAPGVRLLDLGAGSGWPALYFAEVSGCEAVLVDIPQAGLQVARDRARRAQLDGRVTIKPADAAATGLAGPFDVITHSDLLCCLPHKADVLDECRRLLKSGGVMAFSVIEIAEGLDGADRLRAVAAGPEFVEAPVGYPDMLSNGGWQIECRRNKSAALAEAYRRQLAADQQYRRELRELLGDGELRDRLATWQAKADAVSDGLLCRFEYRVRPVASQKLRVSER